MHFRLLRSYPTPSPQASPASMSVRKSAKVTTTTTEVEVCLVDDELTSMNHEQDPEKGAQTSNVHAPPPPPASTKQHEIDMRSVDSTCILTVPSSSFEDDDDDDESLEGRDEGDVEDTTAVTARRSSPSIRPPSIVALTQLRRLNRQLTAEQHEENEDDDQEVLASQIKTVLMLMNRHPNSGPIQSMGCQCLLLLLTRATNHNNNNTSEQLSEIQTTTDTALLHHPTHSDVQFYGCLVRMVLSQRR